MNTSQLSNNYQFLYSPKSWLHLKKTDHKTFYFFLQLFILPYIKLRYIIVLFTTTLLLFRSVNLPIKVQRNLYTTVIFFLLTLSISTYYTTKNTNFSNISNHIIKIQPLDFICRFTKKDNHLIKQFTRVQVYLSLSICRIVIISLTYLFNIKILLLTTNYEEIILSFFGYKNKFILIQNSHIPFTVVLSSQFLKIIFTQLDVLKASYLIRGIKFKKYMYFRTILLIYLFLLSNFFISLYINIKLITQTLHSRDISSENLHLINISGI
uniref:hypothetical protein n=1 Tax=Phymatolithon calcareum TaxID=1277942 RepID=UPI0023F3C43C|nr:hypothetical protein P6G74_pgp082 [Phymatolithon calcareum]WEA76940.1 hypothetical protein [Phymatolithon calcareum]